MDCRVKPGNVTAFDVRAASNDSIFKQPALSRIASTSMQA
jgi:hypothetical protein